MPAIGVAGSSSGVGKTHLIERILERFPRASVLKATVGAHGGEARIVTSQEELRTPGKDTRRYLDAGAARVVWIACGPEELEESLSRALEHFEPGLLVIESNSATRLLGPDIVVFVEGEPDPAAAGRGSPKESGRQIRGRADFITSEPFRDFDQIATRIEEVVAMSEDRAKELITQRAEDNRLPCTAAFKIAEETGVPRGRIGEILNEMEIKVMSCQLGCF